jgi:uncharacterized cupredoxin-like copper-binding protein
VLVAALSSGQKLGLALVAAAFIVFALISAFLIPALRPDYPARRGLPAFLTLSVALFLGMMFAVFFFGRESEEGRAEAGATESKPEQTATQAETTAPTTTAPTTTQAETRAAPAPTTTAAPKTVPVSETEFKIELPSESFSPGSYKFDLKNDGNVEHDLAVKGPGVDNEKTPVIGPGKTASLTVKLQSGTYKLYCSVPGHEQAGMKLEIKVG